MEFKQFIEPTNDSMMQYQARVEKGRAKESKIMDAMRSQCHFDVTPASSTEDILKGIDCYLKVQGRTWSTQIKARQSSEDLLFVITEDGKAGRDIKTQAELYAFVINDRLYLINTIHVRKAINDLVNLMSHIKSKVGRFRIDYKGVTCELSHQNDPVSAKGKLMAFLPVVLFTEFFVPVVAPCNIRLS